MGILQARILEWVAISFFRGTSWPRDQTWVSCNLGRFFTVWAVREPWEKDLLKFSKCFSEGNGVPKSAIKQTNQKGSYKNIRRLEALFSNSWAISNGSGLKKLRKLADCDSQAPRWLLMILSEFLPLCNPLQHCFRVGVCNQQNMVTYKAKSWKVTVLFSLNSRFWENLAATLSALRRNPCGQELKCFTNSYASEPS